MNWIEHVNNKQAHSLLYSKENQVCSEKNPLEKRTCASKAISLILTHKITPVSLTNLIIVIKAQVLLPQNNISKMY